MTFMSPTVRAASNISFPRKKVLGERNESPGSNPTITHFSKSPSIDSKPLPKNISKDSQKNSPNLHPKKPYDPLKNYLSPRPQFLRYNPDRRKDILLRLEMKDNEGDDCSAESDEADTVSSDNSSLASSSSQEDEEVGDEDESFGEKRGRGGRSMEFPRSVEVFPIVRCFTYMTPAHRWGQKILHVQAERMSSEVKVSAARKLFRCQRVEVAYIQETEKEMFSEDDVRKVWYDDDFDFRKEGLSCGLVTIWDKSKFQVERCFIGSCIVLVEGKWIGDNKKSSKENGLWEVISALCETGKNEVDAGVVNQESRISIFFIENCKLFDVPLIGRKFTWYGSNGRRSRLDRVFVEEDWMVSNPDTTLWGLSRSASDHLPRPFKFINVWLKQEGCVETIKEAMEAANKTDNEFHSKAVKIRSKRRTILGPNLGEGSGADPKKLKQKVFNHFQEQFSCNKRGWQAIFNLDFKRLSTMAASNLELPLSLEEIRDDVWSCDDSKAPGPDGFNMLFFKKCWEMANDDLVKVFEKFYRNGNLEKNVNSSILALIPKTSSPKEGRQIFDGILIANEVLHSMQQESNEMGGVILKLDFLKAYDCVR
ncbi:hypothetical protein F3Y22_tig00110430pilonHSYRG00357 [Hibiscus syriacus]|uniref:Reverse transcriptase domain-containing protein n=1 Tax=Hibiscus syriacus TaxID=106335 RepID=A0A6A3AQH2_HIBSY|nr:hypothetical protein F3Y22_tig00110430pilonHSYRG00357 [Hibiscus syriacus]